MSEAIPNAPSGVVSNPPASERAAPASSSATAQSQLSHTYARPRYLPILHLSTGGMANIELAVGLEVGNYKKLVVLKTIRDEFASDHELVAMFLDEARLCARLNHHNLVQVYEVVETPRPCLVMEYLEGLAMTELQRRLGANFDIAIQLRIISEVLSGLQYAHDLCDFDGTRLGIVHRDVSPQNVVVTSDGRVKLLDFGIAKTAASPNYTQAGMVKGKMSFMSPEQFAGEPLDRRADVFAVGCMLWRAASGKKLWAKMEPQEIMRCLVGGKIPPPSIHREVDPQLEAIVVRATAARREQRYASAADLRRAVDGYLAQTAAEFDLRAWMQSTFDEDWAEQRQAVNHSFAEAASVPPVGLESINSTTVTVMAEPKSAMLITVGVVAAVVALLVVGAVGLVRHLEAPAPGLANGRDEPTVSPSELLIRLRAEPVSAHFVVDSNLLEGNPTMLRVPSGSEHQLEVTAPGYLALTRKLRFERETTLEFALVADNPPVPASARKTPALSAPHSTRKARAARTADRESVPPSEDPCETPFYFKDGIKVYKPECF